MSDEQFITVIEDTGGRPNILNLHQQIAVHAHMDEQEVNIRIARLAERRKLSSASQMRTTWKKVAALPGRLLACGTSEWFQSWRDCFDLHRVPVSSVRTNAEPAIASCHSSPIISTYRTATRLTSAR